MKKIIKRSTLLLTTLFSVVGCGNNNGNSTDESEKSPIVEDKYIIQGRLSDYYIVVPNDIKARIDFAASELAGFLEESTKCRLEVIKESQVKKDYKYISLGNTIQFQENVSDIDLSCLNGTHSAYFITTRNDNIYINSNVNGIGDGTLYGVYDMLHDMIDYKYYYEDEIYMTYSPDVHLCEYDDEFVTASFDSRGIGTNCFTNHDTHNTRSRLINTYKGKEWASYLYGHGQIRCYVSPDDLDDNGVELRISHPDWFLNPTASHQSGAITNNQLCWSAGDEMAEYAAQKMIGYFQQFPEATYFMFGQEDNARACKCDRCLETMKNEAMNHAGLQTMLMNKIIDICEDWLSINQPGREVYYVVYAYYATKEAPVIDDGNGNFTPYSDKVIPNKKMRIFYAPIDCNFSFPLTSPVNSDTYYVLKQWATIADGQIIMYLYDTNFANYYVNFNNFTTVKSMYQTCRDYGVDYMYTQGAVDTGTPNLDEMRGFVESNIMWDLSQDYEVLAKDFMDHYYRDASDKLYEYYQTIKDQYAWYINNEEPSAGSIYGPVSNSKLWPVSLVRKLDKQIHEAFDIVKKYEVEDPSLYTKLYNRVMRQYLSVIYLKVLLYRTYYSDEEIEEMRQLFMNYSALFGCNALSEGGDLSGLF